MPLLLITGVPGTGKTTLGDHLAARLACEHLDFERLDVLRAKLSGGCAAFVSGADGSQSVVVTWGFVPDVQLACVLELRAGGFEWLWLDDGGDREASRGVYFTREKGNSRAEAVYESQMHLIRSHIDLSTLQPRLLNPFTEDGVFRPVEEIAAEISGKP